MHGRVLLSAQTLKLCIMSLVVQLCSATSPGG